MKSTRIRPFHADLDDREWFLFDTVQFDDNDPRAFVAVTYHRLTPTPELNAPARSIPTRITVTRHAVNGESEVPTFRGSVYVEVLDGLVWRELVTQTLPPAPYHTDLYVTAAHAAAAWANDAVHPAMKLVASLLDAR